VNQHDRVLPTRAAEWIVTYGLAAYVLTLPLEFTSAILRQQLSRFVLMAVVVAFIYLLVVRRRSLSLPRFPSAYLLSLYLAASGISWLVTRAPGSGSAVLDAALYPVVGLLVANVVLTESDHRRAWIALLVSGIVVAVTGAILYLTHTQIWVPNPVVASRANITFGDPNITARFLTLCACVAVLLFAARQAPAWLTTTAVAACGIVLPLTFSRSGLALFILMMALMVLLAFDRRRAMAMAALALLAFGLSTTVNPDTRQRAADATATVVNLVTGTHQTRPSARTAGGEVALDDERVFLIAAGGRMFMDHPLLGVGFGGYQHALLTTYRNFLPGGNSDTVSHTSFVTVLAEQGVIGAVLLLAFLLQLAREAWAAWRRRDDWATWTTISAAMVVPIFLYSQFEARLLQEPYLWLALGMFYGAQQAALGKSLALGIPTVERNRRSVEAA